MVQDYPDRRRLQWINKFILRIHLNVVVDFVHVT